jgi:regulator of protease activity HflC (stomatin/prohibitin superfamily)
LATLIVLIVVAAVVLITLAQGIRIVPQARAGIVERLGRYQRTLDAGLALIVPYVDRVKPLIDLREQVVSFPPQPVITEDNLVVGIDTVIYFTVTDAKAATYEVANPLQAIEQLTVTTLRNVIGNMDLEKTLTSREHINSTLRGVLDEASGKWGIRVNRVELKAIDPPPSIKDSMEKQMRADREKRAAILNAEGQRQAKILTAEGDKRSAILNAEGDREAAILRADGQSEAIDRVFQAVHRNDPDPKLLAYQYLQVLPELAKGEGNTFWVIPSEVTNALTSVTKAFGGQPATDGSASEQQRTDSTAGDVNGADGDREQPRALTDALSEDGAESATVPTPREGDEAEAASNPGTSKPGTSKPGSGTESP